MNKANILKLYKNMLRESEKFASYNYRNYALRRIRDNFKENKNVTDSIKLGQLLGGANTNLEIIKRQVLIGNLYKTDKLVIENLDRNENL